MGPAITPCNGPPEEVVPRLERFRSEVLFGYPSAIAAAARTQLDGPQRGRAKVVKTYIARL